MQSQIGNVQTLGMIETRIRFESQRLRVQSTK